jgi:hypothetical protein
MVAARVVAVERRVGTNKAAEKREGRAVGGAGGGSCCGGGGGGIGSGTAEAEERMERHVEHGQQPGAPSS